jgi:hypothetical protein
MSDLCRDSAPSFGNCLKLRGTDGYQSRTSEPQETIIGPWTKKWTPPQDGRVPMWHPVNGSAYCAYSAVPLTPDYEHGRLRLLATSLWNAPSWVATSGKLPVS